jgi:glutaredoxin
VFSENNTEKSMLIAFVLSILGIIYTVLELILLHHHSSICTSQGCEFVSSFAVFGENMVIWLGIVYFIILSLSLRFGHRYALFTTLGLTAEGYLLAFQLFVVHTICYFCLGVFSLIFIISLILLFSKKMSLAKYLYPLTIILMVYMIRIPYVDLSQGNNYLFYSPTCPHCHQTIEYLKQHKININLVNADDYKSFLNSFGINQVPCLITRDKTENLHIIVGENEIEKYFAPKKIDVQKIENNSDNNWITHNNNRLFNHAAPLPQQAKKDKIDKNIQKTNSTVNSNESKKDNGFLENYGIPQSNNSQSCTIGDQHCD